MRPAYRLGWWVCVVQMTWIPFRGWVDKKNAYRRDTTHHVILRKENKRVVD